MCYFHFFFSRLIFTSYFHAIFSCLIFTSYFHTLFSHLIFTYFFTYFLPSYFHALFSRVIFTSFFHALFSRVIFTPYFHVLFSRLIFALYFHVLSSRLIFTSYFHALFPRLIFPFSFHTFFSRLIFTSYFHSLFIHHILEEVSFKLQVLGPRRRGECCPLLVWIRATRHHAAPLKDFKRRRKEEPWRREGAFPSVLTSFTAPPSAPSTAGWRGGLVEHSLRLHSVDGQHFVCVRTQNSREQRFLFTSNTVAVFPAGPVFRKSRTLSGGQRSRRALAAFGPHF